jgi:hypothetical protein
MSETRDPFLEALAARDPRYRKVLAELADPAGRAPVPAPPAAALPAHVARYLVPCVHLGAATGARRLCPSCRGKVEVKVLACTLYGECTVARPVEGLACCATCPDYRAAG